jgi:hypothetical protein
LDAADIKRAVETALRQSKFMPTPAELRQLAGGLSLADRAQQAWLVAEQAVRVHSSYRTVWFDDAVINATIRSLGGWVTFCTTETSEFDTFVRQRFLATYEALARSGVGKELAGPLPGEFDQQNGLHGFREQEIRRIACGLPPLPSMERLAAPSGQVPLALPELKKA